MTEVLRQIVAQGSQVDGAFTCPGKALCSFLPLGLVIGCGFMFCRKHKSFSFLLEVRPASDLSIYLICNQFPILWQISSVESSDDQVHPAGSLMS